MAFDYKTPGVYIEEISKFPPSIASVETAIPAFIGYTERAIKNGESISSRAIPIESIAEYEEIYGGAPPQNVEIYLDNNDQYIGSTGKSAYFLYDSIRMFYANGGGKCYIISIGGYTGSMALAHFDTGLAALEKEDEPTIILGPDAVLLSGSDDLYNFQIAGMQQCNKLMDRVMICDLKNSDDSNFDAMVTQFRDKTGINNLKYGTAYAPWLNTNLPRTVRHRNITLKRNDNFGSTLSLNNLTTDKNILQILFDLDLAQKAVGGITGLTGLKEIETNIAGTGKSLEDALKEKADDFTSSTETTLANLENELQGIYDLLAKLMSGIADFKNGLPIPVASPGMGQTKDFNLYGNIDRIVASTKLKEAFDILAAHHNYLKDTGTLPSNISLFSEDPSDATTKLANAIIFLAYPDDTAFLAVTFGSLGIITSPYTAAGLTEKQMTGIARDAALKAATNIINAFRNIQVAAAEYEKTFDDSLVASYGFYKNLVQKAVEKLNLMPPSGAIAGVYASVDRDRGVWKAPANVSLSTVISPAVKISHEKQAGLNVDVNAGKSINIIRSFTGKGTLVWGARTLAGNDNEWRYISVRRFFNMVEESTKKATEQFVFEPNDANTWIKVQAMIENYLTTLWRAGALQGAKPEHAFYVAVGLGKTMTALDILEGRMIVEIGMAAVRPAEFIILRFSHKMAES